MLLSFFSVNISPFTSKASGAPSTRTMRKPSFVFGWGLPESTVGVSVDGGVAVDVGSDAGVSFFSSVDEPDSFGVEAFATLT